MHGRVLGECDEAVVLGRSSLVELAQQVTQLIGIALA
jgi:hypothetical protein